jgi:DMSO/TMAO reductase YedYZ molybdopterin-dependent catalytic subunit
MSRLKISGSIRNPLSLSLEDFDRFKGEDRIPDAARIGFRKGGRAVRLSSILKRAEPSPKEPWITFSAPGDPFFASIPLSALNGEGIVLYADSEGNPIPPEQGGPFRFFIPDAAKCGSEARDECLNVKHLAEIEIGSARGRDTRPARPEPSGLPLQNRLIFSGSVTSPAEFHPDDFLRLDPGDRIEDVREVGFRKGGKAVRLSALLDRVGPTSRGIWITFCAPADPFFASVRVEALQGEGLIIFATAEGQSLSPEEGGPFRFFIPDFGKCGTEARDACLNVKHLQQIVLSPERGRDTRPPIPAGKV